MIEQSSIEALKQSLDIVDVIGSYIELKKAGANYKANCPFHSEKSASFVVSPSKQIYHCFGCGVGGDAIKFVMQKDKLSYPEAIEKLASMYNFSLRYTKGKGDYSRARRALELFRDWYAARLDANPAARDYLKSRGVSQASIELFGIGYAPSGRETMDFIAGSHIPMPAAEEAGIIAVSEDGGRYARLVDRVIFPIHSPAGAIVGFGGRTMGTHPAKYINSPQTKLFNKSRLLYGYSIAKEHIYAKREIVVCEGYLDVIMLHQSGFDTAVATLGTALTAEHLPLLKKGEPKVVLAYDGDRAGVDAALKAATLLASHGFEGRVVLFPASSDPADLAAAGRREELSSLLRGGEKLVPFVLGKMLEGRDISEPKEKERVFGKMKSFLSLLSPIERESYIPFAASLLKLPASYFSDGRESAGDIGKIERFMPKEDPAWLSILKTLLEHDSLVDETIDLLSPEMAGVHREAFEALLRGDTQNPALMRIAVDESIKVLNEELFRDTLRRQLESFYRRRLGAITSDPSIPYERKSWLIRKIKTDILPRLKKGELVPYESDIPL
jgi:DNA primase